MDAAYVWMLGAFLPSEASDRDGDDFRARIANVGEVAGMEYVVERALTEFSNDEHRVETFARVREMLPARARETEMRRVSCRARCRERPWVRPVEVSRALKNAQHAAHWAPGRA